jgi:hypothetical protein
VVTEEEDTEALDKALYKRIWGEEMEGEEGSRPAA